MKKRAEGQKFNANGFQCGLFPEGLLNESWSIHCDGWQSAVTSIIRVAQPRGQCWSGRIISVQPVRESLKRKKEELRSRMQAAKLDLGFGLLHIIYFFYFSSLLFASFSLAFMRLDIHILRVALGKQRGANCKLWSLDEVTAESVAAVSRAVSGSWMLRSVDLSCR